MNVPELAEQLLRSAPGALGSLLSALWLRDILWLRRAIVFVGGWAFSAGAQSTVSKWSGGHLEPGFVLGFMLGVWSMTFFVKVLDEWQKLSLAGLLRDVVRKWFGLPPLSTRPAQLRGDQ